MDEWRTYSVSLVSLDAPGEVDGLPATIEFDPGSFVLTAFGRSNSGTIRGDTATAERYLNLFFRI